MAIADRLSYRIARRVIRGVAVVCLLGAASIANGQPLTADRVLLLYNSADAESLAVRNMYLAARPGVREFDLDDPSLAPTDPDDRGNITRAEYLTKIRAPLLNYLAGTTETGVPLAQHIVAIATTRGLPARISGSAEFQLHSTFSSLESELALVQQDLSAVTADAPFSTGFHGAIDNPYHFLIGQPILSYSRAAITDSKNFQLAPEVAWQATDLTPGDLYLVCRLDAAPGDSSTALENVQALINRSLNLSFDPSSVQALLDEFGPEFDQFDDDGGLFFPVDEDFEDARDSLLSEGVSTLHDETFTFYSGANLPDQKKPLILIGTYGENHDVMGWGANPPGAGTYVSTFSNVHPACVFIAYESFNGNSIINGMPRSNQGQALDFITRGGSFTIAHVAEPFTFTVADLEMLSRNLLFGGMTFAEAAYSAIPALSWQSTPIGDPLAMVTIGQPKLVGDLTGDGVINGVDLATLLSAWGTDGGATGADLSGDGVVNGADLAILLSNWTI